MCVCSGCSSPLRLGKLPPRAIANDNWLGAPAASSLAAKDFVSLTWAELQLLALERTRIVLQLRGASIYSADMKQRGARGNAISHKHDTGQVCTLLPRPVDSLVELLKVIFTSNRPMTDKDLKWAALVDLPKVVRCFQWLQENHPGYANIRLHHAYDDLDPGMLPFVPECVMVSATQLPDGGVADDAHANAGHGNAAGDSSDSDMHISPSAFSPAADSPVPMLPVDDTQQPDSDDDSDIVVDEMGRVWTRDSHGRLSAPTRNANSTSVPCCRAMSHRRHPRCQLPRTRTPTTPCVTVTLRPKTAMGGRMLRIATPCHHPPFTSTV